METLAISEQLLMEDLGEYTPRISPKSTRKKPIYENEPFPQQDFFRHLVSVASHSIGLRASVKPFNSKEGEMLNYLVDVFNITDFGRLKKILISYRDSDAERDKVNPQKLAQIIRSRRRHSWRPELRIRIKPPTFYYREKHYIDNLSIRVYLFKAEESKQNEELEIDDAGRGANNQRTVLNSIFKTSKTDLSNRIRPVNEIRCLVRFESDPQSSHDPTRADTTYKMVQTVNGQRVDGDIRLKIRRRYCEPDSKYILRFEFWLNSNAVEVNWINQYRRYLKRFVYNGSSSCNIRGKSVYQNEDQEFYGYVNYKLNQLPSHAIKLDRPIVTLQGRKMNKCEICIEANNRRLEADDENAAKPGDITVRNVPNQDFIINHIRLYANCFLHHSLKLIKERGESLIGSYTMDNITIDNLFYMSAQTLANQHRLQSNLNKFDDQSLRRIAFLILMNCLHTKYGGYEVNANIMLNLLISLTKNEYIMARKVIDDKTLQELDPFHVITPSHKSDMIEEMEITILRRFALRTLGQQVRKHFLPTQPKDSLNRVVTLAALAMFRRALSHHDKLGLIHLRVKNLKFDVVQLRGEISKILDVIIERHLRNRFESLIKRDSTGSESRDYGRSDSWPALLRDIRGLNNDLYIYWSSRGESID